MAAMTLRVEGIKELEAALDNSAKQLPREVAIAINATSKKVRTNMSKQIRQTLAAKAKDVNSVLKVTRKAKKVSLGGTVTLDHEARLSLKAFGVRQTRSGVSARVSKTGGRTKVPGGFMGPRPGAIATKLRGHAFKRLGNSRKPIVKLHGASPWGAYTKNRMRPETVRAGEKELEKQIQRRIRFNILKRQKLI